MSIEKKFTEDRFINLILKNPKLKKNTRELPNDKFSIIIDKIQILYKEIMEHIDDYINSNLLGIE